MARPKKDDLIDEAGELGLDVDPDSHYDEIFDAVKTERERREAESSSEDDEVPAAEETETPPPDPPFAEPEVASPRRQGGWNALGIWEGRGRPT